MAEGRTWNHGFGEFVQVLWEYLMSVQRGCETGEAVRVKHGSHAGSQRS